MLCGSQPALFHLRQGPAFGQFRKGPVDSLTQLRILQTQARAEFDRLSHRRIHDGGFRIVQRIIRQAHFGIGESIELFRSHRRTTVRKGGDIDKCSVGQGLTDGEVRSRTRGNANLGGWRVQVREAFDLVLSPTLVPVGLHQDPDIGFQIRLGKQYAFHPLRGRVDLGDDDVALSGLQGWDQCVKVHRLHFNIQSQRIGDSHTQFHIKAHQRAVFAHIIERLQHPLRHHPQCTLGILRLLEFGHFMLRGAHPPLLHIRQGSVRTQSDKNLIDLFAKGCIIQSHAHTYSGRLSKAFLHDNGAGIVQRKILQIHPVKEKGIDFPSSQRGAAVRHRHEVHKFRVWHGFPGGKIRC